MNAFNQFNSKCCTVWNKAARQLINALTMSFQSDFRKADTAYKVRVKSPAYNLHENKATFYAWLLLYELVHNFITDCKNAWSDRLKLEGFLVLSKTATGQVLPMVCSSWKENPLAPNSFERRLLGSSCCCCHQTETVLAMRQCNNNTRTCSAFTVAHTTCRFCSN